MLSSQSSPQPELQGILTPELAAAIQRYNEKKITLRDLLRAQKFDVIRLQKEGKKVPEVMINLPLSYFQENDMGKDGLVLGLAENVKPQKPIRYDALPQTIKEAKLKYKNNLITIDEFRAAITDIGGGHPVGKDDFEQMVTFWNPTTEQRPGTNNNKAHTGFKYDCYTHEKGKILQGVVKKAIISALNMGHGYWLKKYDSQAFIYEDPELLFLDTFLKKYIEDHIPKTSERPYHLNLCTKGIDILLGIAKEDIVYRVLLKDMVNTFCGKIVLPLTQGEQEHFNLWCKN